MNWATEVPLGSLLLLEMISNWGMSLTSHSILLPLSILIIFNLSFHACLCTGHRSPSPLDYCKWNPSLRCQLSLRSGKVQVCWHYSFVLYSEKPFCQAYLPKNPEMRTAILSLMRKLRIKEVRQDAQTAQQKSGRSRTWTQTKEGMELMNEVEVWWARRNTKFETSVNLGTCDRNLSKGKRARKICLLKSSLYLFLFIYF